MQKRTINLEILLNYFILFCLIVFLGASYSIQTPFMGDEVLTYHLGSLPSINLVFDGLKLGADSHGPAFHLLNWGWAHLGIYTNQPPEIWTRIPSILFIGLAACLLLSTVDSELPKPMGLILVLSLFTWQALLVHLGENRSYGWVLFLVSCQILLAQEYTKTPQKKLLYLMSIILGLSILSHPMAFAYTGLIIISIVVYKFTEKKRWDFKPLGYALLGCLSIIPWLIAYLGQIESTMSGAVNWANPPTIEQLGQFLKPNIALTIIICFSLGVLLKNGYGKYKTIPIKFWIITGGSFLIFSIGLWILSQKTNPLFLERYILPSQIGWTLIVGGFLPKIFGENVDKSLKSFLYLLAIGMILYLLSLSPPTREATGGFWNKENPWTDAGFSDDKYFTQKISVICESSTTYLPRNFYHGKKRDYILVLDKTTAENCQGVWLMDYKMNKALKTVDKSQKIKTWDEILSEHTKFYLLNEMDAKQNEVLDSKKYKSTLLNPKEKGNLKIELIELIELME